MPLLELTLDLKLDGKSVLGQPFVQTATYVEATNTNLTKTGNDSSSYLQWSQLATDNGLFIITDTAINLKFNNAGALPLNAGGIVLVLGANIAAGATTNITINNNSGTTANIKTLEVGP